MSTVIRNSNLSAIDARLRFMTLNAKSNIPMIAKSLCKTRTTTRAYENFNAWTGVGEAAVVAESAIFPTKEIKQGDAKTVTPQKRGFVINISREMIEDNLFDDLAEIAGKSMNNSMSQTEERAGLNLLNNGFDANLQTTPDGVALFSTAHVLKQGGTQSNTATASALDLDSLWAGINTMKTTVDDSTLYSSIYLPKYLWVPQGLERRGLELVKSDWVPLLSENQDNVVKNRYPLEVVTSPLFTSTTAWGLLANPSDLIYPSLLNLQREAFNVSALFNVKGDSETGVTVDKDVYAWRCRARYAYDVTHWLGTYGNAGA